MKKKESIRWKRRKNYWWSVFIKLIACPKKLDTWQYNIWDDKKLKLLIFLINYLLLKVIYYLSKYYAKKFI